MTSLLEAAVRQWRELGLVGRNRHREEGIGEKSQQKRRKKREKEREHNNRDNTTRYNQTTLSGENLDRQDNEVFGDSIQPKEENNFRVVSQNIQKLPEDAKSTRSRKVVNTISNTEADVFLMSEPSLYWPKVTNENQWFERIIGKFRSHRALFGCNATESGRTGLLQYGGVGLIATDEAATRSRECGKDPTGLGRWVWMRFQGRNNHITRVVTLYRPCRGPGKELSVWEQHNRYFRGTLERDRDPRKAIYEDLYAEAKTWKEQGDHLIIAGDVNEDIRTGQTEEFFRALGMREVILEKHATRSPPATHNKNTKREPIDGIWASEELQITGAGYAPFGEGCESDHRLLWADFSYHTTFGKEYPKTYHAPAKRLRSDDPRLVRLYNRKVKAALNKEKLISRAFLIEELAKKNGWDDKLERAYNKIQQRNIELRKGIEKKLRKLKMGGVQWSPKLQAYRDQIELWSMIVRKKKKLRVSLTRIRRWMHKTSEMEALKNTLTQANTRLDLAHKNYRKAKEKADNWRNEFLDSLAEARAKDKDTTIEAEEKSIKQIERQRKQARNIKRVRQKGQQGSVNMVFETDEEGRHERVSKDDIEDACIRENSQRFSQSWNTPFMTPPLVHDFGYLAETDSAEQVLNRCYEIPDGTDKYAAMLLDQLYAPMTVKEADLISPNISTQEHIHAWKKQDERTSAEPTGLAFNHHKAAAKDPTLAEFDATMRNIPYENGFAPEVWQNITDVEILKKAGVYDINLMRTIQLMNAELNLNNKKLGRDLMKRGEEFKLIAREQFGSRKEHQSITAALNKRLTMDLLRQKRQAGALCSNDAKSCYDRVVHSVATLSMRRLGAAPNGVKSMFLALQKAAHRIRTAFGVSVKKYGHDREEPLQGLGQGNGCGPAGWAVVSTPIINMMRVAGFGATFFSAMSVTLIAFVCYAFVDDTDVVHTAQDVFTTGKTIMVEMQTVIDHWEGGLRATGGAIVPKKSYWYLIDWIWEKNRWRYATIEDIPGDLTIRDTCGSKRVTLKRYNPEIAKETLGVFLAMDGNNKEQIIKLRQKTQEFADQIRTGFLNKWDAWYAINSTIMKTLEYPMLATTITEKEWDFIMRPIREAGLPKVQVSSKYPKRLMYGPKEFQGLGIMHPFLHQELMHVAACIHEGERETITGELIRAGLEQMQLETGLPGYLFSQDYSILETLTTDCWLKTVWQFAWNNEMLIKDTVAKPKLYRDNDNFIMEEVIRHGFRGADLKKINECRMFLQVANLSEISTVDGKNITLNAWKGIKDSNKLNDYQWPRSPPTLSPIHWRLWRKALTASFIDPMKLRSRDLVIPLHDWLIDATRHWRWFYSVEDDELYKKEGLLWANYRSTNDARRRRDAQLYERVSTQREVFIETLVIANVTETDGTAELISKSEGRTYPWRHQQTSSTAAPTSLAVLRRQEPKCNQWAISEWDYSQTNLQELARDVTNGTATAISDGSYKNDSGTSAFMLCSERLDNRIIGVNTVPGNSTEQSAYRSELAGVSGIIHMLKLLCVKCKITKGSVKIGLDGEQAMKAAGGSWPLKYEQADYDLIKDIRNKIKALPIQITWQWIEGHQDDNEDFQRLDTWAQRNIQCDSLAKLFWNHCNRLRIRPPNQILGNEGWTFWFNGSKRSRIHKANLYSELYGDEVCDYWIDKGQIPLAQIHSIDWKNSGDAIKRLPFSKQMWVSKFSSGHCAVGRMMKKRKEWTHDKCPLCFANDENNEHVLKCEDPRAIAHWEKLEEKLTKDLKTMQTAPAIRRTIMRKLYNWKRRRAVPFQATNEYGEQEAALAQDKIGWTNFMLGRMTNEWAAAQQAYYEHLGRRRTGKRWLVAITTKILNISWDMWDHRNGILHHKDHPWQRLEHNAVDRDIEDEYEKGLEDLNDDRWLKRTVQQVKQLPLENKQQWLRSIQLARQPFDRDSTSEYRSMAAERTSMTNWLTPVTTETNETNE